MLRLLAAAIAVALLPACSGERVGAADIPPGRESVVLRFIEPLKLGEPVADGYRLANVEIDRDAIRLKLDRDAPPARATVEIAPATYPRPGFEFSFVPDDSPALHAAIEQAIKASRAEAPWVRRAEHVLASPLEIAILAVVAVLVALTAILLFGLLSIRRPPPLAVAILAVITALGLYLRLTWSPREFLHEYYHTAEIMSAMFQSPTGAPWGMTAPALFRLANRLLGGEEKAAFVANALLATLTIPALVLFDYALFRRWAHALLAGLLLCLLPTHLRFSASEDFYVAATLFACWSLGAFIVWLDTGRVIALVISLLAAALVMNARIELLILPVSHFGLVLFLKPPSKWKETLFHPVLLLSGAVIAAVGYGRVAQLHGTGLGGSVMGMFGHPPSVSVLLLQPDATPIYLPVLVVIGAIWGVLKMGRRMLWLLAFAAQVFVPLAPWAHVPAIYRHQMLAMALFCMIAAGAPFVVELVAKWIKVPRAALWGTASAVAIFALAATWQMRPFIEERFDAQLEYDFLDRAVPRLPRAPQIIAPESPAGNQLDLFPRFLLDRYRPHASLVELQGLGADRPYPDPRPGLFFYQGMYCYFSSEPPAPKTMNERCLGVRNHYELRPVVVETLRARGYSRVSYSSAPFEVGLYEITGVRRAN